MLRPLPFSLSGAVLGLLVISGSIQAETTQQTADYIAVSFEAEEYDSKGLRWVETNASTAQQEEDPDGNHSSSASDGVYLEVLPDYRVTHDDAFHPSGSLWNAGQGPELTYSIDFPESGRYHVHMRSFSTGTEDNGAHIGINGNFPQQAHRVQWCRGKNSWAWSSAQRDSGGRGSCGLEKTVYLDVPSSGTHEINVQAREDGYEIDRIVMIKDLSNNTRICEPVDADQISCRNGSIESADGLIDLKVTMEANVAQAEIGDEVKLTVRVENLDDFDHASNMVTEIMLDDGYDFVSASADCSHDAGVVSCLHADLEPTAHDEWEQYDINLTTNRIGNFPVDVTVTSDETEEFPNTNLDSLSIDGVAELPGVDLEVEITSSRTNANIDNTAKLSITLHNLSGDAANATSLTYTLPSGARAVGLPSQCVRAGSRVTCEFGILAGNDSQLSKIDVELFGEGVQVHTASATSNKELDESNNSASVEIIVDDPTTDEIPEEETPEEETDSEQAEEETDPEQTEEASEETQDGDESDSEQTSDEATDADEAEEMSEAQTDTENDSSVDEENGDDLDGSSNASEEIDGQSEAESTVNQEGGDTDAGNGEDNDAEAQEIAQQANSGVIDSGGSGALGQIMALMLLLSLVFRRFAARNLLRR